MTVFELANKGALNALHKAPLAHCDTCPLKAEPVVLGRGPLSAKLALVGEAPGDTEIRTKMPFVGQSGRLLSGILDRIGVDETQVRITNAVLCRCVDATGKNRPPTATELDCCHDRLVDELKDAERIVTLGASAFKSLLPEQSKAKITKIRGQRFGRVLTTYHPAYVLRQHGSFPELLADLKRGLVDDAEPQTMNFTTWIATDSEDAVRFFKEVMAHDEVVVDLETTGLNFLTDKIICLVLCAEPAHVYIIPAEHMSRVAIARLRTLLNNKTIIGHNLKFDLKFLKHEWLLDFPSNTFDTMLAHYALDARRGIHGLKAVASEKYGVPDWEAPLAVELKKLKLPADSTTNGYDLIPRESLYTYAAADGHFTRRLHTSLSADLVQSPRLAWLFEHIITPAANVFGEMEMQGIRLDLAHLRDLKQLWEGNLIDLHRELQEKVGHDFNPKSPMQLCKILYEELRLPVQVNKDTKKPTTDAAALTYLSDNFDLPFLHDLMAYRHMQKLLSTYVEPLIEQAQIDGRAHSTFNIQGTITGRISSDNVNLLNIPTRSTLGKEVKRAFVADKGFTFVQGDEKGAEVCAIAFYSGDENLRALLRAGVDVHGRVAEATFGKDYTKPQRQTSKTTFFGIAYGQSEKSLAIRLRHELLETGVAKNDADVIVVVRRIIQAINGLFPQLRVWQQSTVQNAFKRGGLESFFGRRLLIPFLNDQAERDLRNVILDFQAQSTASDIVQLALIEFAPLCHKLGGRVLLSVYDSVLCEVPDARVIQAAKALAEVMVSVPTEMLGEAVTWRTEISVGKTWADLEEMKL